MNKSRVVVLVTGAHVLAFSGLLLTQGCGTTRGPMPDDDEFVMPPHEEADEVRPVAVEEPAERPEPMPPAVEPEPESEPVEVTPSEETTTYTVASGDALSVIARRFGVSVQEIKLLNNISDPDRIRVGQQLEIPGTHDVDQPSEEPAEPAPVTAEGETYVVQSGDALSVIAQRHGVSQQELMQANNISDPDRIRVGQELVIPGSAVEAEEPVAEEEPEPTLPEAEDPDEAIMPIEDLDEEEDTSLPPASGGAESAETHTIEIGDDLLSVASQYNVSIQDLRDANDLDSDILVPGRVLVIPAVD